MMKIYLKTFNNLLAVIIIIIALILLQNHITSVFVWICQKFENYIKKSIWLYYSF